MISSNGAYICELVGLSLLNQLSAAIEKMVLVYIETIGLLQLTMQMVKNLIKLGKLLSHYSRKDL